MLLLYFDCRNLALIVAEICVSHFEIYEGRLAETAVMLLTKSLMSDAATASVKKLFTLPCE